MLKRPSEEAREIMESVRLSGQNNLERDFLPPKVKGFRVVKTIRHPIFGNVAFLMRCKGNLFTFFRIDFLKPNGTLDGINFNSQFGRREWNEKLGYEKIPDNYLASIKKNRGFLLSTYLISENDKKGLFISKKGKNPLTNKPYDQLVVPCRNLSTEYFNSELQYGACYDTAGEWLIETGFITEEEWRVNSTSLGNYHNSQISCRDICPNGYKKEWMLGNVIDNLAGNLSEITQEQEGALRRVTRGGCYLNNGNARGSEASSRNAIPMTVSTGTEGVRIAIFLK